MAASLQEAGFTIPETFSLLISFFFMSLLGTRKQKCEKRHSQNCPYGQPSANWQMVAQMFPGFGSRSRHRKKVLKTLNSFIHPHTFLLRPERKTEKITTKTKTKETSRLKHLSKRCLKVISEVARAKRANSVFTSLYSCRSRTPPSPPFVTQDKRERTGGFASRH